MKQELKDKIFRELKEKYGISAFKPILEKAIKLTKKETLKEFSERLKEKKSTLIHSGDEGTHCFVDAVGINTIEEIKNKMEEE